MLDAADLEPFVTWGTNPGQGLPLSASVPDPALMVDAGDRATAERALEYMGLVPGTPLREIAVDTVPDDREEARVATRIVDRDGHRTRIVGPADERRDVDHGDRSHPRSVGRS